jgi:Kef-type K+ transport system membrane component KefB
MMPALSDNMILLIGFTALAGFFFGRTARGVRLPSIIGFMVFGVLMGPSGLGLFRPESLKTVSFITEMALGFTAFGIGAELSMAGLRSLGRGIAIIIFSESLLAFAAVAIAVYALTRNVPLALLFGSVAPASAPAGTVAVIHETRAKGPLTRALYAVVGFDDGLAILIFGFAAALAKILLAGLLEVENADLSVAAAMARPALELIGSLAAGTALGFLFCFLVRRLDAARDMLIMTFAVVMLGVGLARAFHLSLILTCMAIGFVLVNTRREAFVHRVTAPLRDVMPLMFLLFFSLAGAHLELAQLSALGAVGIVYIIARSAGLVGGARLGARLGGAPPVIRRYLGLGILSQAGVAIGLSLIIHHDFTALAGQPAVREAIARTAAAHPDWPAWLYHPAEIANVLITTITATCIVFEIIGPILTRFALSRAGEIGRDAERPA